MLNVNEILNYVFILQIENISVYQLISEKYKLPKVNHQCSNGHNVKNECFQICFHAFRMISIVRVA